MPKVSIIVPVYNNEAFLSDCLDSISRQSFPDFECILIDDGSTDNSSRICDDYCRQDNRFIVIHSVNKGPAAARNIGLDKAQGELFAFADSDDILNNQTLECFVYMLENSGSDAVFADFDRFSISSEAQNTELDIAYLYHAKTKKYCHTGIFDDYVGITISNQLFYGYMHTKMFRRWLFDDIRFPEDVLCYEDVYIMVDLLKKCEQILTLDFPIYHYRVNTNSILGNNRNNIQKQYYYYLYQIHTAEVLSQEGYQNEANKLMQFFVWSYLKYIYDNYNEFHNIGEFKCFIRECRVLFYKYRQRIKNNPLTTRMFRVCLFINQLSVRLASKLSRVLFEDREKI